MRYPILIEEGTETAAFGVVVPDLPGCFSAGDTLDEAIEAAKEAAAAWIDVALDRNMAVPAASPLDEVRKLRGYKGWTVGLIDLEESLFDDSVERVNITLPRRVLRRLDDMARRTRQTRSGLIARLTVTPPGVNDRSRPARRARVGRETARRGSEARLRT
jgi:predicted RNase H-like HicB family nuclease